MTTANNKKTDWKKYAVFAGMGLLFAGAMYMILSPPSKTKEEQSRGMGLNTEVPEPAKSEMTDDKRTAYEQEQVRQMQQERMKTLNDFTDMVNVENKDNNLLLIDEKPEKTSPSKGGNTGGRSSTTAKSSVDAYKDMNRTLGSFYEQPKEDNRVKQLTEEVEILKSQLENQPQTVSMEEQLALMEKSYQMAARFLPGNTGTGGTIGTMGTIGTGIPQENTANAEVSSKTGKTVIVPVSGVNQQVVTALNQHISDAEFITAYSQPRNLGFYTAEAGGQTVNRNTIRACIHDDQMVSDGLETQRSVRIRLIEPMSAGGTVIPAHTILTGQARIGERLDVSIISIEYMGRIYQTDLAVYDVDGQRGIAIPPSMEVNALKEVAANTGSSAGTSITFSDNAGQQIAADLGRSVIQGTSQYISKKMRVVKIHLKAGHQILLLSKEGF